MLSGPNRTAPADIATILRGLLNSTSCLLLHPAGPNQPQPVHTNDYAFWHMRWPGAPDGHLNDHAGDAARHVDLTALEKPPDLVILDERPASASFDLGIVESMSMWAATASSPRIVVVLDRMSAANGSVGHAPYAQALAIHGYFRRFDHVLEVAPAEVALYERSGVSLAELVARYEEALAADRDSALESTTAIAPLAQRHGDLIANDRLAGLMARVIRLQDGADYWRIKFEDADVRSRTIRGEAARLATQRAVARVMADRRYRLGAALLKPAETARRLARKIRSANR